MKESKELADYIYRRRGLKLFNKSRGANLRKDHVAHVLLMTYLNAGNERKYSSRGDAL